MRPRSETTSAQIAVIAVAGHLDLCPGDRLGDDLVQPTGLRLGLGRHQVVVGAPAQHLLDHVAEPGEHHVAGGPQQQPVEGDVLLEEGLQVAGRAGGLHLLGDAHDLGTLGRVRVPCREGGRGRLDRRPAARASWCRCSDPALAAPGASGSRAGS